MSVDQLVIAGPRAGRPDRAEMVATIRASFALVEPFADELGRHFYAELFGRRPETRELFPVNMEVQRSRLLRALVHVVQMVDRPDELAPFLEQLGRDHRKFGVLAEHYDALGAALLGTIGAFSGTAWTPPVEKAWSDAFRIVASAMRSAADAENGPATWLGRVVEHRRLGWDLAVIRVQAGEPVPYRAGQYLSVETPQRPRLWRYLSPANAPRADGTMDFHVRAVAGGWVSRSIVAHSQVGERWSIGPAEGDLDADATAERELLVVAGGTGAAVALALCEDLAAQAAAGVDVRPTTVVVGGRTPEDLHSLDRFAVLAQDAPWLAVVGACESDPLDLELAPGTVVEAVTRAGPWLEHDVVVAGSPDMIRATTAALLVDGTPLDRIHYDPFTEDDED